MYRSTVISAGGMQHQTCAPLAHNIAGAVVCFVFDLLPKTLHTSLSPCTQASFNTSCPACDLTLVPAVAVSKRHRFCAACCRMGLVGPGTAAGAAAGAGGSPQQGAACSSGRSSSSWRQPGQCCSPSTSAADTANTHSACTAARATQQEGQPRQPGCAAAAGGRRRQRRGFISSSLSQCSGSAPYGVACRVCCAARQGAARTQQRGMGLAARDALR